MSQILHEHHAYSFALPSVRHVSLEQPWHWLRAGWHDIVASPQISLTYGLLFALAGGVILLFALPRPHLVSLAVSVFFLLAPLFATGLYEVSLRHERGEAVSFASSLDGWRRNGESIALYGLALALAAIFWERLSAILFALLYRDGAVEQDFIGFLAAIVFSGEHIGFVVTWLLVGGTLAFFVFACSAVSIPMLLERDNEAGGDVASAVLTSLQTVRTNPGVMVLWAALLVTLTLIGIATFLLGLVVLLPLIGHASWHAYRDLVGPSVE
jgi:uncharacterized membrane protein